MAFKNLTTIFFVCIVCLVMGIFISTNVNAQDYSADSPLNYNAPYGASTQESMGKYDPELNDIMRRYTNTPSNKMSPLSLSNEDVRWESSPNSDYIDLVIRKKKDVESILITNVFRGANSTEVYGAKAYGLRAVPYDKGFDQFVKINGNEMRLWGRKFVGNKNKMFFLVDSTPERHPYFGLAFRIRLPRHVEFGYVRAGENHGYISLMKGVMLNVRSFSRKYADYQGSFTDNFFVVQSEEPDAPQRPKLIELARRDDGEFICVHVRYLSPSSRYFKKFMVRKNTPQNVIAEQYEEIGYIFDQTKEHLKARFLSSTYLEGKGKIVEAIVFFKKSDKSEQYFISAMDENDLQSENQVQVIVPPYSYTYTPSVTPPAQTYNPPNPVVPTPNSPTNTDTPKEPDDFTAIPQLPSEPTNGNEWDIQFND